MANRIFVTGDTHGWENSYGWAGLGYKSVDGIYPRFNKTNFPEQKSLDKNDVVIIVGDFGGIWHFDKHYLSKSYQYLHNVGTTFNLPNGESPEEKYGLDWLNSKQFTTLFIPGNHENYTRLYHAYPIIKYCGGEAVQIRDSVLMLINGYVFKICGRKIFTFGGARSHDIADGIICPADPCYEQNWEKLSATVNAWKRQGKSFRVKEVSWWEQEMPDKTMMERGISSLKKNDWNVDCILTHCCSTKTLEMLSNGEFRGDELTDYLQEIQDKTEYKYWFFGHYHFNGTFHSKNNKSLEVLLYEQIIQCNV